MSAGVPLGYLMGRGNAPGYPLVFPAGGPGYPPGTSRVSPWVLLGVPPGPPPGQPLGTPVCTRVYTPGYPPPGTPLGSGSTLRGIPWGPEIPLQGWFPRGVPGGSLLPSRPALYPWGMTGGSQG